MALTLMLHSHAHMHALMLAHSLSYLSLTLPVSLLQTNALALLINFVASLPQIDMGLIIQGTDRPTDAKTRKPRLFSGLVLLLHFMFLLRLTEGITTGCLIFRHSSYNFCVSSYG